MQGLDHAHVFMFHEWYETPKHLWVITELASGGTLADILEQDGCLPFPQVVDFVRDIVSGLSYVHSRQIVYCDLQPHKVGTSCASVFYLIPTPSLSPKNKPIVTETGKLSHLIV